MWEALRTMKQVWLEQPPGTWLFHVLQLSFLDCDDVGVKDTAALVIKQLQEVYDLLQLAVEKFPNLKHCLLAVSVDSVLAQNQPLLRNFPLPQDTHPDVSLLLAISLPVSADSSSVDLEFSRGSYLMYRVPRVYLLEVPEEQFIASKLFKQLALTLKSWIPREVLRKAALDLAYQTKPLLNNPAKGHSEVQTWHFVAQRLPQVCLRLLGRTDEELN